MDDDLTPGWLQGLTRPALQRMFGETTVQRAGAYQRRHAVRELRHTPDGLSVIATVQGGRAYTTVVSAKAAGHPRPGRVGSNLVTTCSCPMRADCKHVVAVILECQTRGAHRTQEPSTAERLAERPFAEAPVAQRPAESAAWEALLAPIVRAPEDRDQAASGGTPLALLIDVSGDSPSGRRAAAPRGRLATARLQLRPLVPGASGAWVRTGISWGDLQYSFHWRQLDPAQRAALVAILTAERVRSRGYYGVGQWISAQQLGTDLWRLLDDAVAAGVQLRTGARADRPVQLTAAPAEVVLDATRALTGDLVLATSLRVPGVDGEPVPIGEPAIGVLVRSREGITLSRLATALTPPLAALLDAPEPLTIPAHDEGRFLTRYYPALRQHARLGPSDDSVGFPTIEPPRLALQVTFEADHQTRLRWMFRYGVGDAAIDVHLLRSRSIQAEMVARDPVGEEALLASLELLDAVPGLRVPIAGKARLGVVIEPVLEGWATVAFVGEVLPTLQARDDVDVSVVGTPLEYAEVTDAPVVAVSTHDVDEPLDDPSGSRAGRSQPGPLQDWFDLGISVTVGGQEVPLATLLTALTVGESRLLLADGTWFSLDVPQLHALRRIVTEARALQDHESERLQVNRYQAGLWEELVEMGVVTHQSERWARSVGALLALDQVPHPEPPHTLEATLRHYQLDGYQWLSFLWDHQLGGILADDMGLGKTLQALSMAERARLEGSLTPAAPMLVVAPTSVVAAWAREAARFTPKLAVATITQTARKSGVALADAIAAAHVVVTSYALFRLDAEHFEEHDWSALVLDEAQFVKNHQSRTYQVARGLRAPVKLAITGTPLENSLMDLWSLLSIVAPGLFPNPQRFGELYRKPIESSAQPELLATLRRRIRPLMLRRTKEAVARELPPKIEQVVAVPLNPAHRRIYDTHLQRERQRILGLLDDADRNRIAILTALTKLRQLSLDVHLVVPDAPASVRSSKIDALLEQLVEVVAEGHRCLVFSQFTRFLGQVRERLVAEGIEHVYLDGRTRDRPKRIAQFTEGEAPVFLISLKAGGSGLTLTQADYVFVLDPWWNPAVEAQAVDRTHRIGQDKTVMVYRLVSEGTIEEKVVALQEHKRALFARVVDEGGLMGAPLSTEDIRGLLEG